MNAKSESPRIYNLFPRLVGSMDKWVEHFKRIKNLGFNWVYINPIHYPGFSGSLYSIKDYYSINPMFLNPESSKSQIDQLKDMLEDCHKNGLLIMMDLVINHTAKDHPFTKEHENWYKRKENGEIKSPGAWDNGVWVEWGDLAEIDNETSSDRDNLWNYWKEVIEFYIDCGFDGFRADAAYAVPMELWRFLIPEAKRKNNVLFFAESLGCPIESTISLVESGFDFIFNSSKWWNYSDGWLLEQYSRTYKKVPSISFPESHDTLRLSVESNGRFPVIKKRTIFTAFFSSGWMIPIGFEYGFKKKLDVVNTIPEDWEEINYDITELIKNINGVRQKYDILNMEGQISEIYHSNRENVLILKKEDDRSSKMLLLILNKSDDRESECILPENFLSNKLSVIDCFDSDMKSIDILPGRSFVLKESEVFVILLSKG